MPSGAFYIVLNERIKKGVCWPWDTDEKESKEDESGAKMATISPNAGGNYCSVKCTHRV